MSTGIEDLAVSAYRVPTDLPESDGTIEWQETTIVLVRIRLGSIEGIGYTYGDKSIVPLITSTLKPPIIGRDPADVTAINTSMVKAIRNDGQTGLAMMAVSAVDIALWDLKAKLLGLPLCRLLGQQRAGIRIYGSGGFTSYTDEQLRTQLKGWAAQGIDAVKIKVGRDIAADGRRVAVARDAIGPSTELYVDANGAYTVSEAVGQAALFSACHVDWLEEPVPAQTPAQLALIRRHLNGSVRIVAGEYGYTLDDFRSLLTADAVDVLQADATRCGGITGFLKAGHLCEAFHIPLSSHCAPAVHLHAALSLPSFSIAEYFHDHVRIERRIFDGVSMPRNGQLFPDTGRPGLGLVFKEGTARDYQVA
jgi:L-alanine-DL-glutamate epimerase-like enolase superfamily enzyme